jgi:hypothetical protein
VERGHPGVGERGQHVGQLVGGPGELRVVGTGLPLGEPEHDREVGGDALADGGDDLGREAGPLGGAAGVAVGAAVGPLPQELVDQVAVRAVQLDTVETDPLGLRRGLGERADDPVDPGEVQRGAGALGAVERDAGRADRRRLGERRLPGLAGDPDVPDLRHDPATRPRAPPRRRPPTRPATPRRGSAGRRRRRPRRGRRCRCPR